MPERDGCPSCDRDLSAPGVNGHICYTYAEHRERIARANAERQALGQPTMRMPLLYEGDQA